MRVYLCTDDQAERDKPVPKRVHIVPRGIRIDLVGPKYRVDGVRFGAVFRECLPDHRGGAVQCDDTGQGGGGFTKRDEHILPGDGAQDKIFGELHVWLLFSGNADGCKCSARDFHGVATIAWHSGASFRARYSATAVVYHTEARKSRGSFAILRIRREPLPARVQIRVELAAEIGRRDGEIPVFGIAGCGTEFADFLFRTRGAFRREQNLGTRGADSLPGGCETVADGKARSGHHAARTHLAVVRDPESGRSGTAPNPFGWQFLAFVVRIGQRLSGEHSADPFRERVLVKAESVVGKPDIPGSLGGHPCGFTPHAVAGSHGVAARVFAPFASVSGSFIGTQRREHIGRDLQGKLPFLGKRENLRQIGEILRCCGIIELAADPGFAQQLDGAIGTGIRVGMAAEGAIGSGGRAVQGEIDPQRWEFFPERDRLLIDPGTVCVDGDEESQTAAGGIDFREIGAEEGFPAGQKEEQHPGLLRVFGKADPIGGGQLVPDGGFVVRALVDIAHPAIEVAAGGQLKRTGQWDADVCAFGE